MNILAGKQMMAVMKDGDEEEKRDDVPGVKVSVDITPMLLPVFKVTKC